MNFFLEKKRFSHFTHVIAYNVWWNSFSRKNVSRIQCNLKFMVEHMMSDEIASRHFTFLTYTAISSSLYSCLVDHMMLFLLVNTLFSHFSQEEDESWIFIISRNLSIFEPHHCLPSLKDGSENLIWKYENMRIFIVVTTAVQSLLSRRPHMRSSRASTAHAQFCRASRAKFGTSARHLLLEQKWKLWRNELPRELGTLVIKRGAFLKFVSSLTTAEVGQPPTSDPVECELKNQKIQKGPSSLHSSKTEWSVALVTRTCDPVHMETWKECVRYYVPFGPMVDT